MIKYKPVKTWQEECSDLITQPEELLRLLELPLSLLPELTMGNRAFPLRVPRPYLARIEKGNPNDPLLRQVLPLGIETEHMPGFVNDPLAESDSNPVPGIVHKYHGRVLLISSSQCAINCRYCFRRHFDYSHNTPSQADWAKAIEYIQNREEIEEAILSGGDPLSVSDKSIEKLIGQLVAIPHIDRIRIHTRLPVVIPARVTDELITLISNCPKPVIIVIHCNHPNELSQQVYDGCKRLSAAGATLLNQTVLLKSVNDCTKTQVELCKRLFKCGVLPYYLHLLDRVSGTSHFEVSEQQAAGIVTLMRNQLPGYLVPKLVRETAGAESKLPVF